MKRARIKISQLWLCQKTYLHTRILYLKQQKFVINDETAKETINQNINQKKKKTKQDYFVSLIKQT